MIKERPIFTHALVIGALVTAIYVAGITIAADLVPPIKTWLASTYGHHWVGKGIWTVIVFVFFTLGSYATLKRGGNAASPRLIKATALISLLSSLVIIQFFIYEYLAK